jgi:hypothetical protein
MTRPTTGALVRRSPTLPARRAAMVPVVDQSPSVPVADPPPRQIPTWVRIICAAMAAWTSFALSWGLAGGPLADWNLLLAAAGLITALGVLILLADRGDQ